MKILDLKNDRGVMSVTIRIEPQEFAVARREAYLDNTERFVVPGFAAGLAPLAEVDRTYGPAALDEAALELAMPAAFGKFLAQSKTRIVGKPQASDAAKLTDGGFAFVVKATLYPKVVLGAYKHLSVAPRRKAGEEEYRMAVLKEACKNMSGEVPDVMTEQKLDSMAAQEKLRVNQDSVYHLLADVACYLTEAYHAAGVSRSQAQIRAEATDVMLQTVSGENQAPSKEFLVGQIRSLAERYHELPDDFDEKLTAIFAKRAEKKRAMSPEELADEAFKAYLGSIDLDEERWRRERREEALESARCDLLLEAVAETEKMTVTEAELGEMVSRIASQCGLEPDEAMAQLDLEPVRQQLLRDKACKFLLDSAQGGSVRP